MASLPGGGAHMEGELIIQVGFRDALIVEVAHGKGPGDRFRRRDLRVLFEGIESFSYEDKGFGCNGSVSQIIHA